MPRIPKAGSVGEETFALHCRALGLEPVREHKFCDRQWRFDFAFPDKLIAVEVEGGTAFGKSRHSRGEGFVQDCLKYNAAARLGWKVFRFTTEMVTSGAAIAEMEQVFGLKMRA